MLLTPRTIRITAFFFLTELVASIILPTTSYALTTGPNQTEFTSYEPIGTTDMVNLISGDFTYNTPLIDVPSPEGGFSLPLSYHSGVGLEDEASWVGLGWNVNAGSISRAKVSNADDDFDNVNNVNVQDPGGSGYVKNFILYQRSWDSEKGYGGAIDLLHVAGFSWNNNAGLQDGTIMGTTFNKDKATFDPGQFFAGLTTIATMGALSGASAGQAIALKGVGNARLAANLYNGYKSQGTTSSVVGGWSVDKTMSYMGFRQDYKYWLDNNRAEHNYGVLYLGQMKNNTSVDPSPTYGSDNIAWPRVGTPANSTPAPAFPQHIYLDRGYPALTSDMYTYVEPGVNYAYSFNPTHLAYDSYSVMGPGIGGNMSPYRPDIGSLAFPKKLTNGSSKVNLVPFLEEGVSINKIQFKYNGDVSNTYDYHDSGNAGMSISYANNSGGGSRRVYYQLNDPKLQNPSQRTEADRDGLYNKRLAQGKHVEWFSNDEMASNTPSQTGKVMEYKPLGDASRNTNRSTIWPTKGIGAYAITDADGTTYHYALPVYNKKQEEFTGVTSDVSRKFARSTSGDLYSRNAQKGEWYATTWLLTGITGPDFVDKGEIGSIDSEDQGYWVKFDYGQFAQFYQWRFPYTDFTPDGNRSTYSKGVKETYYLNTIQTRTHTALFLKDIRKDGRGAYTLTSNGSIPQWAGAEDFKYPASSLSLSEIVLLNNADFQQLQANGFDKNSTTGATIDQTQLNAPASAQQAEVCSLREVFDVYDVQDNAAFRTFLDQKAQRKIVLNTSYTLCPSTVNSFESANNPPALNTGNYTSNRLGKLTLNSISYYGPNNVKLFPDFKFIYNSPNPAYDKDLWDGWGSYNAQGATSHYSANSDPTAWHMTDIVSPLGGRVEVKYESDDYGSISGEIIRQRVPITGFQAMNAGRGRLYFDLKNIAPYSLPQVLNNYASTTLQEFKNQQRWREWCYSSAEDKYGDYPISPTQVLQDVQTNSIVIQRPGTDGESGNTFCGKSAGEWSSAAGFLEVPLPFKKGGGVRVASVTVRDENNNAYRTGYLYTKNGERSGVTSGVVAQEPELVRTADYSFYHLYDFPITPVLYSKVTVVDGMKSDTDFTHKTEYTFNTPDQSCVQVTNTQVGQNNLGWPYYGTSLDNSKLFYFDVQNRASRVGRLERIRTIEQGGTQIGDIAFDYTDQLPRNQGKFTSGSIMCEVAQGPNQTDAIYFKLSRTSKTTYPNVLTAVRTTANGVTTTKSSTAWDFLTGTATQSETTNALGQKFQVKSVPAYTKYTQMRSKAENSEYKNMLAQHTATYLYKLGSTGAPVGVVNASIQTWNKDWSTYRVFNSASNQYETEINPTPVWRRQKALVWNSAQLAADGTTPIGTFTDYNWASNASQAANWRTVSEITQYDHYSKEQEIKGINDDFAASKYGYNQTQLIAQISNAKYTEFAYSGAEDATTWGHFAGEVRDGGRRDNQQHHTGYYSTKLQPGESGFTYQAMVGTDVKPGRTYQASVWLHASDLPGVAGRLYATLNGTTVDTRITASSTKKAADWYLLNLSLAIPTNATDQQLVVGCLNANTTTGGNAIYFDDFRFQPLDAAMQSYVYDTQSWQPTHVLDKDNLFTHYEYDAKGKLYRVYKEILDQPGQPAIAEHLIKETTYNYARNATFRVQATQMGTGQLTSSQPGGLVNQVEIYGDVRYTATSTDCHWLFNPDEPDALKIDGVTVTADRTLTDGTQVTRLPDGCALANVRGSHVVVLKFTEYTYEPAGTHINEQCEVCAATGENTGLLLYQIADGCGHAANNGEWYSTPAPRVCRPSNGAIQDCPIARPGVSNTTPSSTAVDDRK